VTSEDKINEAIKIAAAWGQNEELHHLRWVVDQMLRVLAGEHGYARIVAESRIGPNGEPDAFPPWDEGIAP
jgi:hypothetical protein